MEIIQGEISSLQAELTTLLNAAQSTPASAAPAVQTEIANVQSAIASLQSAVDNAATQTSSPTTPMESVAAALETQIEQVQERISSLYEQAARSTANTAIATEIANAHATLGSLINAIDAVTTPAPEPTPVIPAAIQTQIAEIEEELATLRDIAASATNFAEIETQVALAETALAQLWTAASAAAAQTTTVIADATIEMSSAEETPMFTAPPVQVEVLETQRAQAEEELYTLYDQETINSVIETQIARVETRYVDFVTSF